MTAESVRELGANDFVTVSDSDSHSSSLDDGPALREIRVKGLLSFGDEATFKFGRLNILVGPNGSGKSNLIDCVKLIRSTPINIQDRLAGENFDTWLYNRTGDQDGCAEITVSVKVPGFSSAIVHMLRLGPLRTQRVPLEEVIKDDSDNSEINQQYFAGSYRTRAMILSASGNKRRNRPLSDSLYDPYQSILSQRRDAEQYPEITRLAIFYAKFRVYSEWYLGRNSFLRKYVSTNRSGTQLSENADNLPAALNAACQTSSYDEIKRILNEIKESYKDIEFPTYPGAIGLDLVESNEHGEMRIPLMRLSDGTLRLLAMAAILFHPDPTPVICIEEPELGMHPDMISLVAHLLVKASSKSQLIITTHSEWLLSELQDRFDSLFAFDSMPYGTSVRQFTRDGFKLWRKEHSLGELWTSGQLGGVRY